jgi:hypothetical protein
VMRVLKAAVHSPKELLLGLKEELSSNGQRKAPDANRRSDCG